MHYYKYMGRVPSECFLKDLTIRFSQPKALNDPFELSPEFYSEIADLKGRYNFEPRFFLYGHKSVVMNYIVPSDNFSQESLMVDTKHQLEQFNSKLGVLCLTKDLYSIPKNTLMWAHYGESHCGIAVKFKSDSDIVLNSHPINYMDSRPIINAKIFLENNEISIGDMFFKSTSWRYENEVRFAKHLDDCINTGKIDSFGNNIYVRNVAPETIECIYIGANASSELKELSLEFHKSTGVDVMYLGVGERKYSLIPYTSHSRRDFNTVIDDIIRAHFERATLF